MGFMKCSVNWAIDGVTCSIIVLMWDRLWVRNPQGATGKAGLMFFAYHKSIIIPGDKF